MLKGVSQAMSSKDHPTRRPALQLVEVNGVCRGALPGGDARHMLLQNSLLGALAVQLTWGPLLGGQPDARDAGPAVSRCVCGL